MSQRAEQSEATPLGFILIVVAALSLLVINRVAGRKWGDVRLVSVQQSAFSLQLSDGKS